MKITKLHLDFYRQHKVGNPWDIEERKTNKTFKQVNSLHVLKGTNKSINLWLQVN